jgi:hypothetical protein
MASAVALEDGPRLRSRRVRSGRSHLLSLWIAIVVVALAAGAGFVGVQIRLQSQQAAAAVASSSPALAANDTATLSQQYFVTQLQPIHARIQQNIAETGWLVASYQSGSIDKAELQRQLATVLTGYRDAASQVDALQVPANMQSTVQTYRDTLGALTQSGTELSQAYDDGDEGRVAAALAQSLRATAQWHDLADVSGGAAAGAGSQRS